MSKYIECPVCDGTGGIEESGCVFTFTQAQLDAAVQAEREACLQDLYRPPMHLRTIEYMTAVELLIRARSEK